MTQIFENSASATRYDRESPYQPIMRRNGKMFSAGFKVGAQPEIVAETILEAIESSEYKLRWPVGDDAWEYVQRTQGYCGRGLGVDGLTTSRTRRTTLAICNILTFSYSPLTGSV